MAVEDLSEDEGGAGGVDVNAVADHGGGVEGVAVCVTNMSKREQGVPTMGEY